MRRTLQSLFLWYGARQREFVARGLSDAKVVRVLVLWSIFVVAFGPVLDLVVHQFDPAHPVFFGTSWLNLGYILAICVVLWSTWIVDPRLSAGLFLATSLFAGSLAMYFFGGVRGPVPLFLVLLVAVSMLFENSLISLVLAGIVLLAIYGVYSLEKVWGYGATGFVQQDTDFVHLTILCTAIVVHWITYKFMREVWGARFSIEHIKAQESQTSSLEAEKIVASISHELRTPLTNILGFSELLRSGNTQLDEQARRGLHQNAVQLLGMVNNLLDYSRLNHTAHNWNEAKVLVARVASEMYLMFSSTFQQKDIVLEFDLRPERFPPIYTDRNALERILLNLVSNAIKYTDRGYVRVRFELEDNALLISVEDSGRGMDEETRKKVFDPFFQERLKPQPGTGLGMSLVKDMLERLGGTIQVHSELGVGTSISVSIPVSVGEVNESLSLKDTELSFGKFEAVPEADQGTVAQASIPGESTESEIPDQDQAPLLFVEDQADIRTMLGLFLQQLGTKASIVSSGERALEMDAVEYAFVDLQLPFMDGKATAKRMREKFGAIPIFAMTADLTFDPQTSTEFDGVLYKPFTLAQLERAIEALKEKAES